MGGRENREITVKEVLKRFAPITVVLVLIFEWYGYLGCVFLLVLWYRFCRN